MVAAVTSLSNVLNVLGVPGATNVGYAGNALALGISGTALAGFPISASQIGSSFAVLSSGDVTTITDANISGSQGIDFGLTGETDDTATFSFTLAVPTGAKALSFDFTFLSEEFPEFVGSAFNDFFSATLNTVEFALDTLGQPITVNNNFFSSTLTPTGTFFDGQTPPLTATAPIPNGATTINLVFSVGDVGDGIYDSAAFIGNVRFTENQIVYLEYGASTVAWEGFLFDSTFNMPGFTATDIFKNSVLAILDSIYSDFLVDFTMTKPTSGEFTTIFIGGDEANTPTSLGIKNGTLGIANQIDKGNSDRDDVALVFTKNFTDNSIAITEGLLAQVIAHEAGHLFGLRHISDALQLMYPFAQASSTVIGGPTPLAEIVANVVTPIGGTQDSHTELANNLGLVASSIVTEQGSFLDTLLNLFTLNFSSLAATTLYDPQVAMYNPSSDAVTFVQLPTVTSASGFSFTLPVANGDTIIFAAKSTPDGPYDIFSTPTGSSASGFDFDNFAVSVPDTASSFNFNLAQLNSGTGALSTVAALSAEVSFDPPNFDLLGTEGADPNLLGTAQSETIAGLGGNDTIIAFGGDDSVSGGDGGDSVDGGGGDDVVSGDVGSDILFGGIGNDSLNGGADGDFLDGGGGVDTTDGGDGFDAASWLSELVGVTVNMANQVLNAGAAAGDAIINVEAFYLTNFVDSFAALESSFLYGFDGADTITGSAASDIIDGGASGDTIDAGGGFDYVSYYTSPTGVRLDMITPANNTSYAAGDTVTNAEAFILSPFNDEFVGTSSGQNIVFGYEGADTLTGGFNANNWFFAGDGADRMVGGGVSDLFVTGAGNDTIVLATPTPIAGSSVFEFTPGADKVEINRTAFGLSAGYAVTNGSTFVSGTAPVTNVAQATFLYYTDSGLFYFDPDGTGATAATMLMKFAGAPALTASDLFLV